MHREIYEIVIMVVIMTYMVQEIWFRVDRRLMVLLI
jgi:hypothetical protein